MSSSETTRPSPRLHLLWKVGPWVVLATFWGIGLTVAQDYGPTTDEPWRMLWSRGWMDALATGEIEAYTLMPERQYYGVLYDLMGRLAWLADHHWFGGTDEFRGRHVLNLFAAGLGLLGTHRLAKALGGGAVALLAMVFLATAPRFWGSACVNPKDIPFSAAAVWSAWACIRLVHEPTRRRLIIAGVLAGLCATIRPFGVVFYFVAASALIVGRPSESQSRTVALRVGAVLLIAYATTFATWPVLWVRPPWHLVTASMDLTRHVHGSRSLFMGELHPFWDAPSSYVVVWLGITLPVPVVLGFVATLGGLFWTTVRKRPTARTAFGWGLLVAWTVGPALVPVLKQTTLYDTSRHLLFMVPPICVLAAVGWVRVARLGTRARIVATGVVVLGVVESMTACARLHPYASLYFNPLVGGIDGARGRFDVAHYSETYREGFRWLRDEHPGAAVHIVGNGSALGSYLGWKHGLQLNADHFEFFLSEVRQGWESTLPGEVVRRIERDGVVLQEIRRVEPHTPVPVAYVRAWDSEIPPPPPTSTTDPSWTRIESHSGAFDLDRTLHGQPGFLAVRLSARTGTAVKLIWRYYLGLTVWSGNERVFQGSVVPFQYRGTENFPSVMPLEVPAGPDPTWILVDVSKTRQIWSFGIYAPTDRAQWHDAPQWTG